MKPTPKSPKQPRDGFTLLEVMVACFVFFMVSFAVLELVTHSLIMAKSLQRNTPSPGIIASRLSLTNRFDLESGSQVSGDFDDEEQGNAYPDYTWSYTIEPFPSDMSATGLFLVNIIVLPKKQGEEPSKLSTLIFSPNTSIPGRLGGGPR